MRIRISRPTFITTCQPFPVSRVCRVLKWYRGLEEPRLTVEFGVGSCFFQKFDFFFEIKSFGECV